MRKTISGLLFGSLLLIAAGATPSFAGMDYQINFFLGQKMLDDDDWEPFEDQTEFGVTATFGGEDWPVLIALDVLASTDDENLYSYEVDGSTSEFDVGIRKIWEKNKLRPFVGGGLAFVSGEIEVSGFSVDDDAVGAWVNGGIFWRLGRRFNIGFEARISRAEITILDFDGEAGGDHLGLILGFGSPE
jgi:hypothetical protein